ncbi:6,7-dimethyl-8-ribityllumazine synthase [Candidatus Gottesmanbacteria bacterium]|nr:6,7-dimethyl-8-ribityllumazine synthase [Candidatus Gottesmanbacteria bacterium]
MQRKHVTPAKFDHTVTQKLKIAIIRTDYYQELNDNLEQYCRQTLVEHGVKEENITTFIAPGSWEIPLVAQTIAQSKEFDAIVAFGVIVKGETYHFDMIANECAHALMQVSLEYSIPLAIEVLAVHDIAQAKARASKNTHNKGIEGAIAILKTLQTLGSIQ